MSADADPAFGLLIEAFANGEESSAVSSFARQAQGILDFISGRLGADADTKLEIERGELQWWMLWLAWGQSEPRATELLSALGNETALAEDVAFLRAILALVRDELAVIPEAVRETPAGILLAEAAAVRSREPSEQKRLLAVRIEHATDREFRTLLRIDCAVLCHADGDASEACEFLIAAINERSSETWLAIALLEHVLKKGRAFGRVPQEKEASRLRAEVLSEAAASDLARRSLGVRRWQIEPARIADAWMWAACSSQDDAVFADVAYTAAEAGLRDARNSVGADAVVWRARASFEIAGDIALAAKWGKKVSSAGVLREAVVSRDVLLSHLREPDGLSWLDAALADPHAEMMARAVHFVRAAHDGTSVAQARAWRAQAEYARKDTVKQIAALASAWLFATSHDSAEAQMSLSIALTNGASPLRIGRLAPVLARLAGDEGWLDAAHVAQREIDPGVDPAVSGLTRYVRAETANARAHALLDLDAGDGTVLARSLYHLGEATNGSDWLQALRQGIADLSDSSEAKFGLELLLAIASVRAGENVNELVQLAEQHPSIAWLQWIAIAASRTEAPKAAEIASRASTNCDREQTDFALTAAMFELKAGISQRALSALKRAGAHPVVLRGKELAATWLGEASNDFAVSRAFPAIDDLERFASTQVHRAKLGQKESPTLESAYGGDADLVLAAALGEALFSTKKDRAIDVLATHNESASQDIAMWLRTKRTDSASKSGNTEDHADWFRRAPSLGAARSWLSAAIASKDDLAEPWGAVVEQSAPTLRTELQTWEPGGRSSSLESSLSNAVAIASTLPASLAAKQLAILGWPLLAEGRVKQAVVAFERASATLPRDVGAWLGLKFASKLSGDAALVARSCARLGQLTTDTEIAAAHLEEAGAAFESLGENGLSEACFTSAFTKSASCKIAFDKLFRLARDRKDAEAVLDVTERRLTVADDPRELVKVYWERARAFRQNGDLAQASEALQHVNLIDEGHLGALALSSEIAIKEDRQLDAAIALERLATQTSAPLANRISAAIAAIDIFENKVSEPERALALLTRMEKVSTLPVALAERQVRIAIALSDYATAARGLEVLMLDRRMPHERVEAARLALALYRDKLNDEVSALRAIRHLLVDAPSDGEAIDQLLAREELDLESWRPLLVHILDELRDRTRKEGPEFVRALRLARLAQLLGMRTVEALGWSLALAVSSVRPRTALEQWSVVAPNPEKLSSVRFLNEDLVFLRGDVPPCPFGSTYDAVVAFLSPSRKDALDAEAAPRWEQYLMQALDAGPEVVKLRSGRETPASLAQVIVAHAWGIMPLATCKDDDRLVAIAVGLCRALKLDGNFSDSPATREAERYFDKCIARKERKALASQLSSSLPDAVRIWVLQGREALARTDILFSLDYQRLGEGDGALDFSGEDPRVRTLLSSTLDSQFIAIADRVWGNDE